MKPAVKLLIKGVVDSMRGSNTEQGYLDKNEQVYRGDGKMIGIKVNDETK